MSVVLAGGFLFTDGLNCLCCVFFRLGMKKVEEGFMGHLLVVILLDTTIQLGLKKVMFPFALELFFLMHFLLICYIWKISGWAPQSFTSSRKNRADVKEQSILNFLDEDEKTVWVFLNCLSFEELSSLNVFHLGNYLPMIFILLIVLVFSVAYHFI